MNLRDQIAMSVAGHIWTRFREDGTARQRNSWREGVAVEAYRLADEMLEHAGRGAGEVMPELPAVGLDSSIQSSYCRALDDDQLLRLAALCIAHWRDRQVRRG